MARLSLSEYLREPAVTETRMRWMLALRTWLPLLLLVEVAGSIGLHHGRLLALVATVVFWLAWRHLRTAVAAGPALLAVAASTAAALLAPTGAAWVVGCVATIIDSDRDAARQRPTAQTAAEKWPRRGVVLVGWGAFVLAELSSRSSWTGWEGTLQLLGAVWFGAMTLLRVTGVVVLVQGAQQTAVHNVILTERSALARELHDILAHTLSSLAVDLEGSRALALHHEVPTDLQGRLDRAAQLARSGLVEARGALAALREGQLPGPEGLPALVEGFSTHTGIPCTLTVTGEPLVLSSEARVALYRTAQEALTNSARHAEPDEVQVRVAWHRSGVVLTVEDRAPRPADDSSEGHGLKGMQERARLAGGRLVTAPTAQGFRVELSLSA